MKLLLNLVAIFTLSVLAFAQNDSTGKIAYYDGYLLKDGIYLSVDEFKNNNPSYPIKGYGEFSDLLDGLGKTLFYKSKWVVTESSGLAYYLPSENVWGACIYGVPYYMNMQRELFVKQHVFHEIKYIGWLCYLPIGKLVTEGGGTYPYYSGPTRTYYKYDNKILIISEEKLHDLDNDFISNFLATWDPEMLIDFEKHVKKVKGKDVSLFWLRKFNEKHPLKIPETTEWE